VRCYQPQEKLRILGLPRTATLACLLFLRRALRSFQPDVVHIQDDPQIARWISLVKSPQTLLAYTSWGHADQKQLNDRAFQRGLSHAALLASDASDVLGEITPFAPTAKQAIIRFGADTEMFSPGPPAREVLQKYGIALGHRYIFSPRSIRRNYNQLSLIRALPAVVRQFPNIKLILKHHHVENYPDSQEYQKAIQTEARSLGMLDRITRVDHIPYGELCQLYRASSVAVSIPSEDGFPATIFESMACGCPLIVSNDASYAGVIVDGVNSFCVPPDDVQTLSSRLVDVLGKKELSERFRRNGLETVLDKGDFRKEITKLIAIYGDLMRASDRTSRPC